MGATRIEGLRLVREKYFWEGTMMANEMIVATGVRCVVTCAGQAHSRVAVGRVCLAISALGAARVPLKSRTRCPRSRHSPPATPRQCRLLRSPGAQGMSLDPDAIGRRDWVEWRQVVRCAFDSTHVR